MNSALSYWHNTFRSSPSLVSHIAYQRYSCAPDRDKEASTTVNGDSQPRCFHPRTTALIQKAQIECAPQFKDYGACVSAQYKEEIRQHSCQKEFQALMACISPNTRHAII